MKKNTIAIMALVAIGLLATSAVSANVITNLTEVEFDQFLVDSTIVGEAGARPGGGSTYEIWSSDMTAVDYGNVTWTSGGEHAFLLSYDQGGAGNLELTITAPGQDPSTTAIKIDYWFDSLAFSIRSPGPVTLSLTGNTIDGDSFWDMTSSIAGGFDAIRIDFTENNLSNIEPFILQGTLTPTEFVPGGFLGDTFKVEAYIMQVPEPYTIGLLSIGGIAALVIRRIRSRGRYSY